VVEQGFLVGAAIHAGSDVVSACQPGVRACSGPSRVRASDCRAFVCAVAVGAQPEPVEPAACVGFVAFDAGADVVPACCSGVRACACIRARAGVRACPGPPRLRAGDCGSFVCAFAVGAQP